MAVWSGLVVGPVRLSMTEAREELVLRREFVVDAQRELVGVGGHL